MSILSSIGSETKKVFEWIGSPKGQAVITTGEGIAEDIDPPLTGLINLANTGLAEIVKVEALAAGASQQAGSGPLKLIAVTEALTPQILDYAQKNGLPAPTSAQIQAAINGLVAFGNALEAAPVATPTPTPVSTPAAAPVTTPAA